MMSSIINNGGPHYLEVLCNIERVFEVKDPENLKPYMLRMLKPLSVSEPQDRIRMDGDCHRLLQFCNEIMGLTLNPSNINAALVMDLCTKVAVTSYDLFNTKDSRVYQWCTRLRDECIKEGTTNEELLYSLQRFLPPHVKTAKRQTLKMYNSNAVSNRYTDWRIKNIQLRTNNVFEDLNINANPFGTTEMAQKFSIATPARLGKRRESHDSRKSPMIIKAGERKKPKRFNN